MGHSLRSAIHRRTSETGWRRAVLAGAAVAVLLRLGLVAASGASPTLWEYHDIAMNILEGRGWARENLGTTYYNQYSGVPYIALTTAGYALFPPGFGALLTLQASIAGLGVLAVAELTRRIFDWKVAVVAALAAGAHPALVYYDVRNLHPLGLDAALGVLALLLLTRLGGSSRLMAFVTGVVLGAWILQRGSPALFVPIAFLLLWRFEDGRAGLGRRLAWAVLGLALVVGPWLARSVSLHGRPLLVTTTGQWFWRGNVARSYGSSHLPTGESVLAVEGATLLPRLVGLGEIEQNDLFWDVALRQVRGAPWEFTSGVARKLVYFWSYAPQTGVLYPSHYRSIYLLYYAAAVTLAAVGLWRWWPMPGLRRFVVLVGALFLVVSLTHAVLYFEMRHRWALEPLILIFSAAGLIGPAREEGGVTRLVATP